MAIPFLSNFSQINALSEQIYSWYALASYITISAVLIRNFFLVKEPDQRRRSKIALYGTMLAVIPQTLLVMITRIAFTAGSAALFQSEAWKMIVWLSDLSIFLIPVTWGYAILKHQLYDINVVVRTGVKYLLARNALRTLLALPIIGVLYGIVSKPDRPLKDLLFDHPYIPILLVLASLGLAFRKQLSHWIDRRFFREAYNQEQTLIGLIDEIRDLPSMPEMARRVSQQLDATLHPERVYVFYRAAGQHNLSLGYSSSGEALNLNLPAESLLLRTLDGQKEAHEYPSVLFDRMLSGADRAWLEQLQTSLVVPMCGADERLSGLLLLGTKKSEEPYSGRDRHLLESIARQMAVVYENFSLRERVDRDAKVRNEVLAKLDGQQINLLRECPSCGTCFDSTATNCAKCGTELTLTLPVERTIEGKYRLEQLLGKGGMGAVYHATDLRLERKVAVKIITGKSFGDQAALRRFEREARASAKLNHPNIVSVYDYGQTGAEGAYLVMEFIAGITLREELTGALPPPIVADWFEQLLEGMKAAHAAGVIHRDLKPENVLLTKPKPGQTQLKILDFGLAKLRHVGGSDPDAPTAKQQSLTAPGTVMGTLSYMSPEQLSGEDVDERGDIFALGVMVVEALTGERPFKGNSMTQLLASILQNPYRLSGDSLEELRLNEALQKCLAKMRGDRFGTIAEMQATLIPAIRACPQLSVEEARR
jgi:serine/threonine protein kinase